MDSVTIGYSINGGSSVAFNLKTKIDEDMPSGYKCLGVVGFSTNDVNVYTVSCRYENSNYSLQLKNTASGTVSNNCNVYYLRVKS